MDEDRETLQVLVDSPHRLEILETVNDGPIAVGDLSDELDLPRATAKHNLSRLADAALIQSVGSRYSITTFGTYTLSQVGDCLTGIETSRTLAPFLSLVSPETFDVDPSTFADSSVITVSAPTPYAPVERLRELVDGATYVRMVTPVLLPQVLENLLEGVLAGDVRVDLVAPASVLERGRKRATVPAERVLATGRLVTGCYQEEIPFGLFLFEDRLALAGHDDENIMRCLVETRSPSALEWAADRFSEYERGVERYLTASPDV